MDEVVIKYYRRMLREGFEHAGSLENPSVFLDSVGERIRVCGGISNYLNMYINIRDGVIDDIKYKCTCDPTANVAVEILCHLIKGKTIEAAAAITEDSFSGALGSWGEDFRKKTGGLIELLNRGLTRYRNEQLSEASG